MLLSRLALGVQSDTARLGLSQYRNNATEWRCHGSGSMVHQWGQRYEYKATMSVQGHKSPSCPATISDVTTSLTYKQFSRQKLNDAFQMA